MFKCEECGESFGCVFTGQDRPDLCHTCDHSPKWCGLKLASKGNKCHIMTPLTNLYIERTLPIIRLNNSVGLVVGITTWLDKIYIWTKDGRPTARLSSYPNQHIHSAKKGQSIGQFVSLLN